MTSPQSIALTGTYNTADTGPSRVLEGISGALADQGIEVHAFTHGDKDKHPHRNVTINQFKQTLDSIPVFLSYFYWVRKQIAAIDPDIIHPLEEYPFSSDIRTVQWTSDSYERWRLCRDDFRGYGYFAGDILLNVANRIGASRTNTVIASSPETKRQMKEYWRFSPDTVVPLGIDAEIRTPPSNVSSPPRILLPGRITPKKGQRELLSSLTPESEDYQVDIVGGISDKSYWKSIPKWHENHHGFVPRNQLLELYEEADIVVVPAIHENFSLVALEAIASGCTLIITSQCGFGQLESAQTCDGVVTIEDADRSGQKVIELSTLGERELSQRKQAAYELSAQFTWATIANNYLDIYRTSL